MGVPQVPPHLLPGRSARWWRRAQPLALALVAVVFCGFGLVSGYLARTQTERDALTGPWLLGTAVAVAGWIVTVVRFRVAARREQAAGYTTISGSRASIDLPGRVAGEIRLFSTAELWELDDRTGAVIRRPGEPTG